MTMAPVARASSSGERTGTPGLLAWAMYDWANQAYGALIQTFVFAVYFTQAVAENPTVGTARWGTMLGISGLIVAVGAPILGAIADQSGRRKPWIIGFTLLCIVATAFLWFVQPSTDHILLALVLVGLATIGSEIGLVFYNSLLPQLVPADRIGRWSGWSWSLGYAGGIASLATALVLFIWPQSGEAEAGEHVRATALLAACWYLLFSLPLFVLTPDGARCAKPLAHMVRDGMRQLNRTVREIRKYGPIVRFLVAHMLYIDGLGTLFAFGGIYAAGTFGMAGEEVLIFGIALNVTAGIGAFGFAWVDDRIGSKPTILISLAGLIVAGTLILLTDSVVLFWTLSLMLGVFIGPAQAAGRSLMAHMAPRELQNQMFGLFALSGKATAFVGPLLVGWITYWAGSQRVGMVTVVVFFVLGLAIMATVPAGSAARREAPAAG
jgi:UMF1 family MFS transporter